MTTIPSSRAAVATALFLALFGGCVLHDGKISPGEQRIIERKFEPNPRRHGTEGSAKVQPQSSHDSSEACGSEEDPMVRLGCLVFFYDGFTVMDAPGVQDKVACATCHDPANNFSDGRARAVGATGKVLGRRTPSLYQAFNRDFLFWDGRIDSLWAQAMLPFENMDEMATNRVHIIRKVAANPELRAAYLAAYPSSPLPDPGTVEHGVPCPSSRPHSASAPHESCPLDSAIPQKELQEAVQAEAWEQVEAKAAAEGETPAEGSAPIQQVIAEPLAEGVHEPALASGPPQAWCDGWQQLSDAQRKAIVQAFVNIGRAIATYELEIRAEGSKFDEALATWRAAGWRSPARAPAGFPLSEEARRGLELFVGKANCVRCHSGPDLSDDQFHYLGIFDLAKEDIPKQSSSMWLEGAFRVYTSQFNCRHAGEYGATCTGSGKLDGRKSVETLIRIGQRFVAGQVRTPSLRNVANGTHFMHDGSRSGHGGAADLYSHVLRVRRPVLVVDGDLKAKVPRRKQPVAIKRFRPVLKRGDRRVRNIRLTETELRHLSAFLETLTGKEIDAVWRTNPWPAGAGDSPGAETPAPAREPEEAPAGE